MACMNKSITLKRVVMKSRHDVEFDFIDFVLQELLSVFFFGKLENVS